MAFDELRLAVLFTVAKYWSFDHQQENETLDFGYDATEQGVLFGAGFHT
jgi:hypothetical protein